VESAIKQFAVWLVFELGIALFSILPLQADESAKSSPPDTTRYSRPAVSADRPAAPAAQPNLPTPGLNLMRQVDTVVNNTNPNLKNTDTFNDGETSIAINPSNYNEIVITAFSGCWVVCGTGNNAPVWVSLDGGSTWTEQFTVPVPPSGAGVSGCPCDQMVDYGPNNELFGTFLGNNIYSGSTPDPTSLPSWAWWLSAGVVQTTDHTALNSGNADQPQLLHNRGTVNAQSQNVFVAYDDFSTSPVNMRVAASVNNVPPQFPSTIDNVVGTSAGAINPGHRLASDPRNGWVYSLHENCLVNCAALTSNPKTIQYILNRSEDQGSTRSLNSSSTGIVIDAAFSTQPQPKFGTVNALLGGVDHLAVDPSTGDVYVVYGAGDGGGVNNGLAIRRTALPSHERQVQATKRTHLIHRPARDIFPPQGGTRVSSYRI
jgi:hypothetical protein